MGLELKVSQVQKISQNMIQQVNVLQMSSQELNAYVKELSMENPIMELDEPEPDNQDMPSPKPNVTEDGYELPDFISDDDDVIKID